MPWLAYERTVGNKLIATIWQVEQVNGNSKRAPHVVLREITEEEAKLPIDELKVRYPYASV